MKPVRAVNVFNRLTTVPTRMKKYLHAFSTFSAIEDSKPLGISDFADGYRHVLRIETEFWIDSTLPNALESQLKTSKAFIINQLYGDVLEQLLPIKRELCNGNAREAYRLIEELEKSILEQE